MDQPGHVDILLVEDSDTDAELTIRALRKRNLANSLMRAHDGEEALDFVLRRGPWATRDEGLPKLILLDLKMPKVDGIEVLRTLKGNAATKHIPVVMLTSSAEERDMIESYALGVNSYLVKPVSFVDFVEEVSNAGFYWMLINRTPDGPDAE